MASRFIQRDFSPIFFQHELQRVVNRVCFFQVFCLFVVGQVGLCMSVARVKIPGFSWGTLIPSQRSTVFDLRNKEDTLDLSTVERPKN